MKVDFIPKTIYTYTQMNFKFNIDYQYIVQETSKKKIKDEDLEDLITITQRSTGGIQT